MGETKFTPAPWEYIASTEYHGPYVVGPFGGDVCDCYAMSNPSALSVRNGGDSKPIPFQGEFADANAHLIASSPDLYAEGERSADAMEAAARHLASEGWDVEAEDLLTQAARQRAALAKARGETT